MTIDLTTGNVMEFLSCYYCYINHWNIDWMMYCFVLQQEFRLNFNRDVAVVNISLGSHGCLYHRFSSHAGYMKWSCHNTLSSRNFCYRVLQEITRSLSDECSKKVSDSLYCNGYGVMPGQVTPTCTLVWKIRLHNFKVLNSYFVVRLLSLTWSTISLLYDLPDVELLDFLNLPISYCCKTSAIELNCIRVWLQFVFSGRRRSPWIARTSRFKGKN